MAASNSTSTTIETRCGTVRLRKRGQFWHARKQHEGRRLEFSLHTSDLTLAVGRAHSIVPEMILGAKEFVSDGRSLAGHEDYKRIVKSAKARAKINGIAFDLSESDVADLIQESNGVCSLTHIPFSMARHNDAYRAPYAPSLDRINSMLGYEKGNVRLVCVAVNWALSDWGQDVFEAVATGYVSTILREMHRVKNGAK